MSRVERLGPYLFTTAAPPLITTRSAATPPRSTLDAPSIGLDLKAAIGKGVADELRRRLRRFIR